MFRAVTLHRMLKLAAAPIALSVLSACGGGGGGGVGVADGGIRGTGSSVGPVSGFGSVFVNGVKFETDGRVSSDDGIEREDQLQEGMILRIEGEWRVDGRGNAESVEYDDTFRGLVANLTQTLDADGMVESVQFTIYGQTVVADQQTVFKDIALETLADGAFVRISGWREPDPDGRYRASHIGLMTQDETNVEIEGRIDEGSLQLNLNQFSINGQSVSYTDSAFAGSLTEADLADLLLVEAEGTISNGVLIAREIDEGETRRYRRGSGDDIEFSGPVSTDYNASNRSFRINGLIVFVDDDTEFDDGLSASDLTAGMLIQVEGDFQDNGSVLAEEIEAREGNASVDGVLDVNTLNFNDQTFRVGGVLVQLTPRTIITDDDSDLRLKLADLNGSYQLEVEGIERQSGSGVVLEAIKVERNEEDNGPAADREYESQGQLTHVQGTVFTVLGIDVQTTIDTQFEGTSRDELIDAFDAGQRPVLEVEYREPTPGNFVADEIELESED